MRFHGLSRFARSGALAIAASGLATAIALGEDAFIGPRAGVALEAATSVELRWTMSCPGLSPATEAELVLSLDGGLTFPIRVSPELDACGASFRWEVPNLPTARARLALRAGSGEASEAERIEMVSAEFEILASSADRSEDLVRGSREWWTRQAVAGVGAEELPPDSMTGARDRLVATESSPDMSEPSPRAVDLPRPASVPAPGGARGARTALAPILASRSAAPAPLRL